MIDNKIEIQLIENGTKRNVDKGALFEETPEGDVIPHVNTEHEELLLLAIYQGIVQYLGEELIESYRQHFM